MFGYVVLLVVLLLCASLTKVYPLYKKYLSIFFSAFFIVFVGLRFDVGTDYFSYEEIFRERYEVAEFGYNLLNRFVYNVHGEYWGLTIITASIIVICLYRVFKFYHNFYLSFFLYIIMSGGYAFMVNGTRQAIAASFILFALCSLNDKKKVFLFWVIASCFHLSAVMLFPFYWILKCKYPSKICFCVYLFVFLLSYFINWGNCFINILSHTYYSNYVLMLDTYRQIEENSTGLGFLLINLLGFVVLYKSNVMLRLNPQLLPFVWFYFFFLVFRVLLADLPIFLRITIYFDYAMYIVIPCYLQICYKKWNKILAVVIVSSLLLTLFVKSVSTDTFNLKYKFILLEDW